MKKLIELQDVKESLIKGTISEKEASDILKREDNQLVIHQFIDNFKKGIILIDETKAYTLANIIEIAYYIYTYSGEDTGITDSEYDVLYEILSQNGKENFVTLPLIESKNKISYHVYPRLRGTLGKVHYLEYPKEKENKSRKSLEGWIDSVQSLYQKRTGRKKKFKDLDVYVFPKWDGVSVIFEFNENGNIQRALTRGYTKLNTAEDVTHHFKDYKRENPSGNKYGLKTEVLVLEDSVTEYNQTYGKDYKQSRSIASGIINSDKPDEKDSYLVVMQLRYMEEGDEKERLCPEVFNHPFIQCKLGDFEEIERFAQDHRFTEGLRCDGAVIHIIDPEVQDVLGRDNDINKYEVAYKFTEEYSYSEVVDIEFQVGLLGRITPVVKIKPVKMKGNTITGASLSNIERLSMLKLAKGDKVKILYDIIPYATIDGECESNRSGNPPIIPKEKCPSCGFSLERVGSFLMCTNPDCDCRKKGKILNYLTKFRIMDISYATVDSLYEDGILTSIEDIYRLKDYKDAIVNKNGFGEVSFNNWIKQIDSKRRVPDYLVLGAIGIDGIAEKNFAKILEQNDMDDLIDIVKEKNYESLTLINGIGEKKAKKIVKGIKDNMKLIKFLWNELDVYHENPYAAKFTVCFTKIRDPELEKYIISLGGSVVDNVTKTTTYLVVPNMDTMSNSVRKAMQYGTKIIPVYDLREELKRFS